MDLFLQLVQSLRDLSENSQVTLVCLAALGVAALAIWGMHSVASRNRR